MEWTNIILRVGIFFVLGILGFSLFKTSEKIDCQFLSFDAKGNPIMSKNCNYQSILQILSVFSFCTGFFFLVGMIKLNVKGGNK
jgi:hypothetical protein